jgi:hypothetical protein
MKKLGYLLLLPILFVGCSNVQQAGKVNMISNRNVDPNLEYKLLTTYSGGSKKELKKSKATSIESALDETVRRVPGGEFVMNAKIYKRGKYFALEGDVWGTPMETSFRGFKMGDKVTWKNKNVIDKLTGDQPNYLTGVISALKNDKTCLIKVDGDVKKTIELSYEEITKL